MKSVRWFFLLVALVTVGLLLTACSPTDPNSSAVPNSNSPAPAASNAPSTSSPGVAKMFSPPYPGAVDRRDCEAVGGWVIDSKNPKAETKVEIYIDGKLVSTVPAKTLRPDLTNWSSGLHGFTFKIPAAYKDGKSHEIKVKVAGSDYEVPFYQAISSFECKA